jgi:hypothetical protein
METALGAYWNGDRTAVIRLTVEICVAAPEATHPHSHGLPSHDTSRFIHRINNYKIINNENIDNYMFSTMWHLLT